jgi:hypothetical protein
LKILGFLGGDPGGLLKITNKNACDVFAKTNVFIKIESLIYGSPDSRVIINVTQYLIFIEVVCVGHTKLQYTKSLKLIFFLLPLKGFRFHIFFLLNSIVF